MTILLAIALLCPTGLASPDHDTLTIEAGCPAPFSGTLYTFEAHDGVARDFATLDALVMGLRADRDHAREERDECRSKAIDALDACPSAIYPHYRPSWLWLPVAAIAGAILGAVVL